MIRMSPIAVGIYGLLYFLLALGALILAAFGAANGLDASGFVAAAALFVFGGLILGAGYPLGKILTRNWTRPLPWWSWILMFQWVLAGLVGVLIIVVPVMYVAAQFGAALDE